MVNNTTRWAGPSSGGNWAATSCFGLASPWTGARSAAVTEASPALALQVGCSIAIDPQAPELKFRPAY